MSFQFQFGSFLAIAALAQLISLVPAQAATPTATCSYDSSSGKPNPLGMRALLTLEEKEGDTTAKYWQFPSRVGKTATPPATISSTRELTFYKTNLAAARQLLLKNPMYYQELLGSTAPEDFKPVNDTLKCSAAQTSMTGKAIADLPDGTYRFWNGKGPATITDDELLKQGGVLGSFTKQGNRMVGSFGQIDNVGVCVQGTVSGNTITGMALPAQLSNDPASRSNKPFDPAGFLKLGTWKKMGMKGHYEGSTLNLGNFTRINPDSRKPVKSCS